MKKFLILILAIISLGFIVNKAEAKWWIFGQGNDETGFDYLYLNDNSYEELGSKAVLYKDSLTNGSITIKGKTNIKSGKVGYVKITKNNKQTWEKAKVSDSGTFTYSFSPDIDYKYQVYIEVSDTMGKINNVDETYKEISVLNESINGKVIEAINNMIKSYENEESNLFMTYVSSDFAGDSAVLDSAVRKDFNAFDLIKINPFINNITSSSGGKVYVAIQYNRTVVSSKSGQTYTDKGYTEFVLTNENGKFKVFSMKNPLIFGLSDAGNVATGTLQASNNDPILLVDNSGNVNEQPFRTAIDIIENDSDINGSGDSSSSDTVNSGNFSLTENIGFRFSSDTTLPETHQSDIYLTTDGGGGRALEVRGRGPAEFIFLGSGPLSSYTQAPTAGYTTDMIFPIGTPGSCYALHTVDNKYAIIKITSYNGTTISIDYKYQSDGSTNF